MAGRKRTSLESLSDSALRAPQPAMIDWIKNVSDASRECLAQRDVDSRQSESGLDPRQLMSRPVAGRLS
jgi:hypothetical protein